MRDCSVVGTGGVLRYHARRVVSVRTDFSGLDWSPHDLTLERFATQASFFFTDQRVLLEHDSALAC